MLSLTGASLVLDNTDIIRNDKAGECNSISANDNNANINLNEEMIINVFNNDKVWYKDKSLADIKDVIWCIGRNGTEEEFKKVLSDSLSLDKYEDIINGYGSDGYTLGHWCATRCNNDNTNDNINSKSSSHSSSLFLQELLRTYPNYNLNMRSLDNSSMCPIHWAASIGSLCNVNFILKVCSEQNNIDSILECRDKAGCTPLLVAAQYGHADLCAFLIKRGANVHAKDKEMAGALHWAAYNGWQSVIGLLCYQGFLTELDLGDADSLGHTALHLAALQGKSQVMQYILEEAWIRCKQDKHFFNSQLRLRDNNNHTALDLAIEKNANVCVVILEEWQQRCSPDIKNKSCRAFTCFYFKQLCSLYNWKLWLGLLPANSTKRALTNNNNVEEASFYQQRAISPMVLIITLMTLSLLLFPLKFWSVGASRQIFYLHASTIFSMICMWLSFILTFKTNPGVLANNNINTNSSELDKLTCHLQSLYDKTLELYANNDNINVINNEQMQLCHSCHIVRPLRSKHCRVQRKCILLFDHYCPFVGNTIGLYNYPHFYLFLVFLSTSIIGFILTSLHYLEQRMYKRGAFEDLDVIILLLFISLFFIPSFGMTIYHTCLAIKNLTTNELQNWRRYDYLLSPSSSSSSSSSQNNTIFYNPFDKGIINNIHQRFFPNLQHQVIAISNSNSNSSMPSSSSTSYSKYGSTTQDDIESSISNTNYVAFA